jgi:hypothetical protein
MAAEVPNKWKVPTEVLCKCCVGRSTKFYMVIQVWNMWEVPTEGSLGSFGSFGH